MHIRWHRGGMGEVIRYLARTGISPHIYIGGVVLARTQHDSCSGLLLARYHQPLAGIYMQKNICFGKTFPKQKHQIQIKSYCLLLARYHDIITPLAATASTIATKNKKCICFCL